MADIVERMIGADPAGRGGARFVPSPFQFLLDGNDSLRVEGWNSKTDAVLDVFGRFVTESGEVKPLHMQIPLTNDRQRTVRDFTLARGYLLTMVVTVSGVTPLL